MDIIQHPYCTHDLGAPSDMQDGSCETLPVMYQETENGTFAISFWKPSEEELKALNNGEHIALWVRAQGRQHPVVSLSIVP